jgi:hypothetical protein
MLDRHLTVPDPWSAETKALVERYALKVPSEDTQAHELGLAAVTTLLGIVVGLVWTAAGAVTSSGTAHHLVYKVGVGALAGCLAGVLLHAARFYAASFQVWRFRRRNVAEPESANRAHPWPLTSSDLDLLLMAAVGILVGVLVH